MSEDDYLNIELKDNSINSLNPSIDNICIEINTYLQKTKNI